MIATLQKRWDGYTLLDSGEGEKLERFGNIVVARPEPQAIWSKALSEAEWETQAHATFRRADLDQPQGERGTWQLKKGCPEQWQVTYKEDGLQLVFRLGLTSFKHVGLFPEQAAHWQYVYEHGQKSLRKGARMLNLFAYTGAASLAARATGMEVTHLDSVRQVISWSRGNMELSNLQDIRWVVEDALTFVQREVRRGNTYEAIVLDPPAYGRGPDGEKWILEDHLPEMMRLCGQLLRGERTLLIMNLYSLGLSGLVIENLLKEHFEGVTPEIGELYVEDAAGRKLPLGTFGRFVHGV